MKNKIYHTGGKQELIEFLAKNPDKLFSAEELCVAVYGERGHKISTVYRHLSSLCEEKTVRKSRNNGTNRSVYQYVGEKCDCRSHFHEKCLSCGRLHHLDCDDSVRFIEHLLSVHGFAVDCGESILYGLCAECRAKEGGNA